MAFSLPSVKVKPECSKNFNIDEGSYGVPDVMKHGFSSVHTALDEPHPLMKSEANFLKNQERMNLVIMRNVLGLQGPLKLNFEANAAKKIGRLPFLPSSNVMSDSLSGRDIEMGFEDILNTSEFREVSGQPHAMVEKSLGIL